MDIFLGQKVVYFVKSGIIAPELRFFQDKVTSVKGGEATFVMYEGAWADPTHWSHPIGTINLRIPPYSRKRLSSPVKVGGKGVIGWFGTKTDRLLWQAAWLGGVIPTHAVDLSCPNNTIAVTEQELAQKGKAFLCRLYGGPMPTGTVP